MGHKTVFGSKMHKVFVNGEMSSRESRKNDFFDIKNCTRSINVVSSKDNEKKKEKNVSVSGSEQSYTTESAKIRAKHVEKRLPEIILCNVMEFQIMHRKKIVNSM